MNLSSFQHDVINIFLNHACASVITSQSIHVLGKCSISRVIASLCQHVAKERETARLRCFLYDVIYYDVIGAASLIGACAMVYPGCMVRTESGILENKFFCHYLLMKCLILLFMRYLFSKTNRIVIKIKADRRF